VFVCVHVHTCVKCQARCTHTHARTHTHTHTRTHTRTHTLAHTNTHTHTRTRNTHTNTRAGAGAADYAAVYGTGTAEDHYAGYSAELAAPAPVEAAAPPRGGRASKWDAGPAADADVAAGVYVCVLGGKNVCWVVKVCVCVRGERTGKWDAGPAADADVAAGVYVCVYVCVLGGKSV